MWTGAELEFKGRLKVHEKLSEILIYPFAAISVYRFITIKVASFCTW
jgi:hypothetical protein